MPRGRAMQSSEQPTSGQELESRRLARAHGAEFDLLVVGRAKNEALHIDAGQVDAVGAEAADGYDFRDLGDAALCRGRHRLDEVPLGLAEAEVGAFVGLTTLDEGEVGADAALVALILSVEIHHYLGHGNEGA